MHKGTLEDIDVFSGSKRELTIIFLRTRRCHGKGTNREIQGKMAKKKHKERIAA
jgi:hypothetical protein